MHGIGKPNPYDRQPARPVLSLHHHGSRSLLIVIADPVWAGMYRIQWPDGTLSDLANLTRIKDAAEAITERGPPSRNRRDLCWKQAGEPPTAPLVDANSPAGGEQP